MSRPDDKGFTLVELIVTVVIVSILSGVMLQAMFVGLRTMDETNARVAGSNDTQFVAGYFTSDVASATTISTTGTKSHETPSVSPTVTNTRLVSFWGVNGVSALTVQPGLSQGWNAVSSSRFRIAMADEAASAAGATGARGASSADGTSSITHSVALAPALLATIARRACTTPPVTTPPTVACTASTPGDTKLLAPKPSGTAQNDRLLAHVAVAGGTTTSVTAPTGWILVNSRDSGTNLKSVVFQKLATNAEPATNYEFSFKDAAGNPVVREAVIGIAAYSGVSTTVCGVPGTGCGLNKTAVDMNPCGGETPVLLLSWTDRHFNSAENVDIEVGYNSTLVGKETHLIRNRCTAPSGAERSGIPASAQTLASNLAPAAAYASCVSSLPAGATSTTLAVTTTSTTAPAPKNGCLILPVTVTMSLSDAPSPHEPKARTYLVRASTRTDRAEE